ncbi:MAG: hypothetical protein HYY50_02445 [Candidatus Kerfeldbacteria bacterium]|nr:hypothetical protein [Candidatus Kerfeldbacteria bacterium]
MSRLATAMIIAVHLLGLAAVMVLETIRPGFVTGAVSLTWVWLGSIVVMSVTIWQLHRRDQ